MPLQPSSYLVLRWGYMNRIQAEMQLLPEPCGVAGSIPVFLIQKQANYKQPLSFNTIPLQRTQVNEKPSIVPPESFAFGEPMQEIEGL